jgi:GTP cyclohydrolase I
MMNEPKIAELMRQLLLELGENPEREGLVKTPRRIAAALTFLTSGYRIDLEHLINGATFHQEENNMVVIRDIELYSLCEHHLLPFYGRCHVGYLPRGRVFGISKIARLVDMFARRLQLQERLTDQIARVIMETIDPCGVGVVIEAHHLCMMMRGVQKQNSILTTSSVLGSFRSSRATRSEFFALIDRPRP